MQSSSDSAVHARIVDDALGVTFAARSALDMQYEALDRLCQSYNNRVTLSDMRFYPKGGSLYRFFWEREAITNHSYAWQNDEEMPACYNTGDVDGWLVVVPRGLQNKDLAKYYTSTVVELPMPQESKHSEWGYSNVDVRQFYNMAEEAYSKVFNKNDAARWLLEASVSGEFSFALPEKAFLQHDKKQPGFAQPDTEQTTFEAVPVYANEYYNPGHDTGDFHLKPHLGLTLSTPRTPPESLDVHFSFLQPACRGELVTMMLDAMYNATPITSNTFVMEKLHFFTDQLRLMFKRLYNYFALAVLDEDTSSSWTLGRLLRADASVKNGVAKLQGVLKSEKTLCRVETLSPGFHRMTLDNIYHARDSVYGDTDMGYTGIRYSQCRVLKKRIGLFNALTLSGLNTLNPEHKYYEYPKASAAKSDTSSGINVTRETRNNLICDDMTVRQTLHIVRRMFDNVKSVGTASIARARTNAEHFGWCVHDAMQFAAQYAPPQTHATMLPDSVRRPVFGIKPDAYANLRF